MIDDLGMMAMEEGNKSMKGGGQASIREKYLHAVAVEGRKKEAKGGMVVTTFPWSC